MASEPVDPKRRIAVLTSGGHYAERILVGLGLRGVTIDAVFIADRHLRPSPKFRHRVRRLLTTMSPAHVLSKIGNRLSKLGATHADSSSDWTGLACNVVPAGPLNSPGMVEALLRWEPDYLILAGAGIVSEEVLRVPRLGTLNVHPALLPFIRGVGVVARSIERGVPVGVTAHFVNRGIDTGEIIRRELLPVGDVDTLNSLRHKAAGRSVELMVELVARMANGIHPMSTAQTTRFPYCTWPTSAEEEQISQLLRSGAAKETYGRWLEFYGSNVLPAAVERYPAMNTAPLDHRATSLEPIQTRVELGLMAKE